MLALENRFDLRLHYTVMLRPLGHDRDEASRGYDIQSHICELCGCPLRLRVHREQRLGSDVLHTQTCSVEGEAVLRLVPLALAQRHGELRLHGGVRTRDDQPDAMHRHQLYPQAATFLEPFAPSPFSRTRRVGFPGPHVCLCYVGPVAEPCGCARQAVDGDGGRLEFVGIVADPCGPCVTDLPGATAAFDTAEHCRPISVRRSLSWLQVARTDEPLRDGWTA